MGARRQRRRGGGEGERVERIGEGEGANGGKRERKGD